MKERENVTTHITFKVYTILKMRSGWFGKNGRGREGSMDAGGNLITSRNAMEM